MAKECQSEGKHKGYCRLDGLKDHVLRVHYGVIWLCSTCFNFFPTMQARSKHLFNNSKSDKHTIHTGRLEGIDLKNAFQCLECSRWFSAKKHLAKHKSTNCVFEAYEKMRLHYDAIEAGTSKQSSLSDEGESDYSDGSFYIQSETSVKKPTDEVSYVVQLPQRMFCKTIHVHIYPCPKCGARFDVFHKKYFHSNGNENNCIVCETISQRNFQELKNKYLTEMIQQQNKLIYSCGCVLTK